ncbi:MAG: hypothetical protein GW779_06805 [Candidatus Altiarchaeum hamiconexum]|uniref:Uncharacterized protein n=1 Tax=Candidatus Altarchaeum hamiconexum TaxID=1803513 RepID=A0A8J8CGC3_9ARCH|nr:hypothetical protein [Candidatus Altarchaeum hamiconexum]NCN68782.1 hypothetical protein [Candidatus Altarchaeum hamiconexum]NCS92088.1 hypothetical protein [Candidatus Altarchaeum hamiconexum]NCT01525.1 hypothetical protein [Candidatus Altarchaeum hamiconexum]
MLSDYKKEEAEEEILKAKNLSEKQDKVKGVDLCDEILNNLDNPNLWILWS